MIQICLCDDDREIVEHYKTLLCEHIDVQYKIKITTVHSGEALLVQVEKNIDFFDIIIIDIEMGKLNGIQTITKLREKGFEGEVIYLSALKDYVFQAFDTNPLHYIVKYETDAEKVLGIVERALARTLEKRRQFMFIGSSRNKIRLTISDIIYMESKARKVMVHTNDGKVYDTYAKLSELADQLSPMNTFVQIHKSYLVNFKYITGLQPKNIILESGGMLPIGRLYAKDVKEKFSRVLIGNHTVS